MLRQIPVDQNALGAGLEVVGVRPKLVRSNDGQGEPHQKGSSEGLPLWTVQALIRGDASVEADILKVTIAASVAPSVTGPCVFENLVAFPYNFNGNSGVSFSAESVAPATPNARPGSKAGADE